MAARRANASVKVTKSTSTGDLGIQPPFFDPSLMTSAMLSQPSHKSLTQQSALNPPPFSHGIDGGTLHGNIRSALGQRFTPMPVVSNMQTPLPVMRPPMFPQGYNMLNAVTPGFMPGGMYTPVNGMYPRFPPNGNFAYPPYNMPYVPYPFYQAIDPMTGQYQPNLIPLQPRADSSSEPEFFPILMSDSEYTDPGFRSYDEMLKTQRYRQECLQAQLLAKTQREQLPQQNLHPKPVLESQGCAKTQFLQRLKSDAIGTQTSRPCSSRKSHNTAPPSSPAESDKC